MTTWLRTDEAEEAISALENLAEFAARVSGDLFAWRWTILSLHNALQGFMVVWIRDSAGLNVLPRSVAIEWLAAHQAGASYPEEKLDRFPNLYTKIKKQTIATGLGARRFSPSGSQTVSVKRLNDLRNTFVHFLPASWSLEVTGLPRICLDSLDVLEYLAFSYRSNIWHDDGQSARISRSVAGVRATLTALDRAYRAASA